MICALCEVEIPAKRMAAVPSTQLCVSCKSIHDEPPLRGDARVLAGVIVETSIGDLEEKQRDARETAGGLSE